MKAVILCAGFGKRLRPYTDTYQKTMIPVHGKPLLEYIINGIIYAGIKDLIFVVGYRKEQIINYFQDGSKWNINIEYIEQENLNGTGGAVLLCENSIKDKHFFLTWGDILVPFKIYRDIYETFIKENLNFILVTNYTDDPHKGGAIYCDGDFCLDYVEKPPKGRSKSNLNNCGIFIFSSEIFDVLKKIEPSERGELEIPDAVCYGIKKRNWKVRVIKMGKNEFRADFGDIEVYERLKENSDWLRQL